MSKKRYRVYLDDILTSVERIKDYTKNLSKEDFLKDLKTIDAVVRNIEILGEAARNIPEDFKEKYPELPWSKMISMRNKVIHEYSGIDLEILWQTVQEDIPSLEDQVKELVEN
ncbi:DUF86 domain-containing protein [Candidatus Curtissbacteria bacterium]|nr:DUF86 domain-containing protein [Candidatus Curtissbacteria bacterium]